MRTLVTVQLWTKDVADALVSLLAERGVSLDMADVLVQVEYPDGTTTHWASLVDDCRMEIIGYPAGEPEASDDKS